MTKSCSAYNCTNRFVKGKGISFHKFPLSNKELTLKWIFAIRRKDFFPSVYTYICSEHFSPECFYKKHQTKLLKKDAVPTIFNFSKHLEKKQKTKPRPKEQNLSTQSVSVQSPGNEPEQTDPIDHTYCVMNSPKEIKCNYEENVEDKDPMINTLQNNVTIVHLKVLQE